MFFFFFDFQGPARSSILSDQVLDVTSTPIRSLTSSLNERGCKSTYPVGFSNIISNFSDIQCLQKGHKQLLASFRGIFLDSIHRMFFVLSKSVLFKNFIRQSTQSS